jgi:hypothetical protein
METKSVVEERAFKARVKRHTKRTGFSSCGASFRGRFSRARKGTP